MGLEALKRFDIYRKIPKDLTQATTSGALVSVCCVAFITLMLMTGNLFATNVFNLSTNLYASLWFWTKDAAKQRWLHRPL